mmetsp:Transcript_26381/g.60051  ORF Transcript_26381/g.60051 Transcript_26381/m.60051 type:complete len:223 (+) Transcript_26381:94-762(+)
MPRSSRGLICGAELDGDIHVLVLVALNVRGGTLHSQPHLVPWHLCVKYGKQVVCGADRLAVHGHHDVPEAAPSHGTDARGVSGTLGHDLHDHDAIELQLLRHDVRGKDDAENGAPHKTLCDDALDVLPNGVNGNGKTDAREGAAAGEYGSVHAYHLAVRVQERAATVPGVDGGVRLDDAVDGPATGALHLARDAADDAAAEAVLQAERIAEGKDVLTDQEVA